ncbi:MarC family protein [Desulfocurvus sp. DL9XJH121]
MNGLSTLMEIAFPLFLIMDPVGNGALCLSLLGNHSPRRQRRIILRELLFALVVIVGFMFLGEGLLGILGIRQSTLRMAGGVILFIISMRMVFPSAEGEAADPDLGDPFIVPIAVPFIAGPSCLAAVMVYAHRDGPGVVFPAICLAWAATAALMLAIPALNRALGRRGLRAMERLMGLVLILMSFQMLEDGVRLFIASL